MKNLLLGLVTVFSLSSFAQSYMIMDSGAVLTTDAAGFVYDFGHTSMPHKITLKGGQYFVEENSIIATIDENGNLYRKYEVIPDVILGKGVNYFLSNMGELYTIDSKGVVHLTVDESLKRAINFGGNYFTVAADDANKTVELFIVGKDGTHMKAVLPETLKMKDVIAFGGSYFMTNRGLLYTVAADGNLLSHPTMRIGILQKRGGNYFTDSTGMFYTVAETGLLIAPALPISLKVSNVVKHGTNYFVDLSGRLFSVDKQGNVFERMMRDQDFTTARVISL